MTDDAFYFGCWSEVGHYLFDPNGRNSERRIPVDFPVENGDIWAWTFVDVHGPELNPAVAPR